MSREISQGERQAEKDKDQEIDWRRVPEHFLAVPSSKAATGRRRSWKVGAMTSRSSLRPTTRETLRNALAEGSWFCDRTPRTLASMAPSATRSFFKRNRQI